MSQPDSGEYSVRSLAEILREHGLESELGTRPGRRRRPGEDVESTGRSARVESAPRTPRADPPVRPVAARAAAQAQARAQGQAPAARPASRPAGQAWTPAPEPSSRPAAGLAGPVAPARTPAARTPDPAATSASLPAARDLDDRDGPAGTGRFGGRSDVAPPPVRTGRRKSDAETAQPAAESPALFGTGPATSAVRPSTTGSTALPDSVERARRAAEHPVTGPIPVVTAAQLAAADAEPLTGRQGALAWARFVGELVVALAVGIGLYFAFTVLWGVLPYVAMVVAPLTITGLVAGVYVWRQRHGEGAPGVPLLAVLLLAGTVLTIAPAAGLLAAG
ncbi:hypothetical protein [Modestobacter sp. SSW1-42]|uniref:hypothetical protein n=1 Tax=Modestobacter sp. SSW1-42 TaxID=596372 RepID=UPI003987D1D1